MSHLSKEDQIELVRKAQAGQLWARDLLITSNTGLVYSRAAKFKNAGNVEFDDIVQEGFVGLIKAIEKYEFDRGASFATYAVIQIDGTIKTYISDKSRTVRIPINKITDLRRQRESGEETTDTVKLDNSKSLNVAVFDDGSGTYQDNLEDTHFENYFQLKADIDRSRLVCEALESLPKRESDVIRMIYGIGCAPMGYAEIGEVSGYSKMNVVHIHKTALRRLRKNWRDLDGLL